MRILALILISFLAAFLPHILFSKMMSEKTAEKAACVIYFFAWTFTLGILLLIFT